MRRVGRIVVPAAEPEKQQVNEQNEQQPAVTPDYPNEDQPEILTDQPEILTDQPDYPIDQPARNSRRRG